MCTLNWVERERVKGAVVSFLNKGTPFTGWEVFQAIKPLDQELPAYASEASEVSSYVRELFNKGYMEGWASTQARPGKGPVVYFKVPRWSKAYWVTKKIREKVDEKERLWNAVNSSVPKRG